MVKYFTFVLRPLPRYSLRLQSLSRSLPSHSQVLPFHSQVLPPHNQSHQATLSFVGATHLLRLLLLAPPPTLSPDSPPPIEFGSTTQTHQIFFRSDHTLALNSTDSFILHYTDFTSTFINSPTGSQI